MTLLCKNPKCDKESHPQRKGFCHRCYQADYRKNRRNKSKEQPQVKKVSPTTPPTQKEDMTTSIIDPPQKPEDTGNIATALFAASFTQNLDSHIESLIKESMGNFINSEMRDTIQELSEKVDRSNVPYKIKLNDLPEVSVDIGHHQLPLVVLACSLMPVMLVGPSGTGKSHMAEQVAEVMGLSFYSTGAILQKYELLGFIGPQGLVSTPFRQAWENGGLFTWDEIDASNPSALVAFNQAIANGICAFPDGMIKRHDDFKCIASANTYGNGANAQYVGRNPLDQAVKDRYAVIDIGFDQEVEMNVVKGLIGLPTNRKQQKEFKPIVSETERIDTCLKWVEKVQKYRTAVESLNVRHLITMRASSEGAKLLLAGVPKKTVEDMIIWKGLDTDTRNRIINA